MKKGLGSIALTLLVSLPWVTARLTGYVTHEDYSAHALAVALAAGTTILAAAFLLSWAGEAAQLEVAQALALAFLAFVAVLPEYSVDMYFSWKAGKDPAYLDFPVANMTGANRLLIGIGWPAVLAVYAFKTRRFAMELGTERRLELGFLLIATIYSFVLPLKGSLSLGDAVFFVLLFVLYMRSASAAEHVEPEILGPAEALATLPRRQRRVALIACFAYAAAAILLSAEPFAESLVATGRHYHINEFLLVQWLAPLASESPEFLVALLFAWRGFASAGLGTLVSSKVNQWTLLVGLIPVVYSISTGSLAGLVLSARQTDELLLTSAQSLFAIAVLADLRMVWWEGLLLVTLFAAQFVFPGTEAHHALAIVYLFVTVLLCVVSREKRRNLWALARAPFATIFRPGPAQSS